MSYRNTKNNFIFLRFPHGFVPEEIAKKYDPRLKAHQSPFKSTQEFLNSLIINITFPSIAVDNVTQTHARTDRNFRGGLDVYRGISKDFSIEMRLTEGYLSYFMLYDILIYWNDNREGNDRYLDNFVVKTLDLSGREIATLKYEEVLFNGISGLTLSYSDITPQFNTFTIDFNSNVVQIQPNL